MAIQFDTTSQGSSGTTTLSFSHTCSGTNRFLVAAIVASRQNGSDPLSSVTYGGVSMTLSSSVVFSGNTANLYLYTLVNPPSGSNSFSATIGGSSGTIITFAGVLASYTGAKQTGQPEANGTGTNAGGTTSQVTLTTTANAWLIAAGNSRGGFISSFSGTQRGTSVGQLLLTDSNGPLVAGSNTISMTGSSNLPDVVGISMAVAPSVLNPSGFLLFLPN